MIEYIVLVVLAAVAIFALAAVAISLATVLRDRQEKDAALVKRLTDQIVCGAHEQIERLRLESIAPAAEAYKRSVDEVTRRNGWTPPISEEPGAVTIPDRGMPLS